MSEEKKTQLSEAFYAQDDTVVLEKMNTTTDGLSAQEAQKRLETYGENVLDEGKKKSLAVKFFEQFKDFMIIVLLAAAVISAVFSHDVVDSIIILVVVILNAIFGVIQEAKAEQAIEALKEMSSPNANVRRDGHVITVKSDELVPGDIVLLEAGDVVPADLRLLEANSLKIEEAALTGESVPVEKEVTILEGTDIGIGDRINMAYSNSNVTYGRGLGVVVGTGMNTEVGKIAGMLASEQETETPLKQNLNQLGKMLTIAILVIAAVMFVVGMMNGRSWIDMLLTSISLAVAAIPEGLPAIVTIILALGTQKMAKKNAIVRKLPAVETLGSTDIICSDKTGTLTLNQMTVEALYTDGQVLSASTEIPADNMALKIMNFTNDTKIAQDGSLIGDPTETALVQFGLDHAFNVTEKVAAEPRVAEIPFDSDRKLMTTVHELKTGGFLVSVKGAPDELLKRCTEILSNGETSPLDETKRQEILKTNTSLAKQALRVLGMAYKYVETIPAEMSSELVEKDLTFAGLVGMIDPERKEAADAVKVAKEAGIRPIMITGDHRDTAEAIAARLGIIKEGDDDAVITGAELNELSDEKFAQVVGHYSVYARVSPEHKVRIVKAWQQEGKVVAMTGDGVLTLFIATMLNWDTLLPVHLLWINLVTDTFPAIALGVEPAERDVMSHEPRGKKSNFFSGGVLSSVVYQGITQGALTLIVYKMSIMFPAHTAANTNLSAQALYDLQHGDALTMAFATLGLIQLFHAFNVKSIYQSIFKVGLFRNKSFNYGILVSFLLLAATIVIPGFNDLFSVTHLDAYQWAIVAGTSFAIIPIVEIVKFFQRKAGKGA